MEAKAEESPMKLVYPSVKHSDSPKTSLLFAAQARSYESKKPQNLKQKVVNPFNVQVQSLVNGVISSPTIFVIGQSPENKEFTWNIDQLSKIQPAVIESPQYASSEYDESTESKAQEALDRFFAHTFQDRSPDSPQVQDFEFSSNSTPSVGHSHKRSPAVFSTPCPSKTERKKITTTDASTQTDYSFPEVIPPEHLEILKIYFKPNQENMETEENSLNSSSLRRKLFFDNEAESLFKGSYVSPEYSSKPPRMDWRAEEEKTENELSSPDLSPINSFSERSFNGMDISLIETKDDLLALPLENNKKHHTIFNSTTKMLTSKSSNQDTGYSTMDSVFH